LLDPETFEIKCVVDWEYAGFYPKEVESEYWRRPGPLAAMSSRDNDDKDDVLGVLWRHRVQDTPVKPASESVNAIWPDGNALT
jgi:thiamine kinase-like enzyme